MEPAELSGGVYLGGGAGGLTNLAPSRRDGHQLEQPLAPRVCVEGLDSVLGRRLNLSGVGAALGPAAKKGHLLCTRQRSVMTVVQQLWKVGFNDSLAQNHVTPQ